MVLLQPRLNLKVSQKQILTPGLVQMVSVLALNKLELRDMITAEMVENPVLEEFDPTVPLLDEVGGREEARDRATTAEETVAPPAEEKKDPFEEIDFDRYFQEYLDPGYRTSAESETIDKPSFENFLSKPATLTDHLMWQLGSIILKPEVREAAELVIGNLDDDGYLVATEAELMGTAPPQLETRTEPRSLDHAEELHEPKAAEDAEITAAAGSGFVAEAETSENGDGPRNEDIPPQVHVASGNEDNLVSIANGKGFEVAPAFTPEQLRDAIGIVQQRDPIGVAARDLRECLLLQLKYQKHLHEEHETNGTLEVINDAIAIAGHHLRAIQNKQFKEFARAIGRPPEAVTAAMDYLRTLDPRPGRRYNTVEPRLIEPDVAFIKQGDEYLVLMNDDDLPQLRLNPTYKRLLSADQAEKDVRTYVKERYKSAIQLIKNIEQWKQTILKVCYAIIGRQREFLDFGIDQLKPMMIKEVAEEIGVHPSTVSRAVASKYAHTAQGVFELRYFFSESVNGPEGSNTSLLILKRRVKKLIEEEDPARPLTDEQITRILQSQGIQVTRRTVAKYREDMKIPSTHQRRVKN